MRFRKFVPILLAGVIIAGCSMFVSAPAEGPTGDSVVLILFKDKEFKRQLSEGLGERLLARNYTIVTDDVKRAKYYDPADYAAVVYVAEYWAFHTPRHAVSFYSKHDEPANVVFVITAGDPDLEVHEPFDAVTCTSTLSNLAVVSGEIMQRLDTVLMH